MLLRYLDYICIELTCEVGEKEAGMQTGHTPDVFVSWGQLQQQYGDTGNVF